MISLRKILSFSSRVKRERWKEGKERGKEGGTKKGRKGGRKVNLRILAV